MYIFERGLSVHRACFFYCTYLIPTAKLVLHTYRGHELTYTYTFKQNMALDFMILLISFAINTSYEVMYVFHMNLL